MESRVKLFGHAIHPMLIPFPLGLLVTAVIFDVIYLGTGNGQWAMVSFWMIAAGVIGGLAAAVFGFMDWLAIPAGTRAKAVGLWHGLGNVVVMILFGLSWLFRREAPTEAGMLPFVLALLGGGLGGVTGWLGGELVERLGVGVDDGAHLDAPNSLSGQAADASHRGGPATGAGRRA